MSKFGKIVILGPPASGKGTIATLIVNKFKIKHISSGHQLRQHIINHTSLGIEAKKFLDSDRAVPDDFMVNLMLSEIRSLRNTGWLLDGFPRTVVQAERLWSHQHCDLALHLDLPYNVIIERVRGRFIHLASGRTYNLGFNDPRVAGKDDLTGEDLVQRRDDRPEVIKDRLVRYQATAQPVIDFYADRGILKSFQGTTTGELWPQIDEYLQVKLLH